MQYKIQVSSEHVRSIKDPNNPKIRIVHALVNVNNLPLDIPLDPDPRMPKLTGPVPQRIIGSLKTNDGKFHLKNRGITISARGSEFENDKGVLKVLIPEGDQFGILDGAHTYKCIKEAVSGFRHANKALRNGNESSVESSSEAEYVHQLDDQYVHLEILSQIEDDLADIAEARNYSVALKAWTLANYRDKFDWVIDALGRDWAEKIIRVSENDPQPVGILDVIQVLSAVNPKLFPEEKPPIDAYKNAGKMLQAFIAPDDPYHFRKLAPVCKEILMMHDYVRLHFKKQYNAPDESGRRGKFGATREAQEAKEKRNRKSKTTYYFIDSTADPVKADNPIDKGFSIPLISGFRVLLKEEADCFVWLTDPAKFFDAYGTKLVRSLMNASDSNNDDPHVVGRDSRVYQQLTSEVRRWYLESRFSEGKQKV